MLYMEILNHQNKFIYFIKKWYKQADGWDFIRIVIAIPTIPLGIGVILFWILKIINFIFNVNL